VRARARARACVLVVLMFKNKLDVTQKGGRHLVTHVTLDKPMGFLVHLPAGVDYLGSNLLVILLLPLYPQVRH